MQTGKSIRDWQRLHESLGYVADGKGGLRRDPEKVEQLKIKNGRDKRLAEQKADTGL